jgi:serine/threonine protein kinase
MMEYIQGDELDYFVLLRKETISLWTKLCLLLNLIHGLRYLSNYGIVHLDLKPINVLVCRQLITKIIDYGEAYHPDVCDNSILAPTQTIIPATPSPTSPPKSSSTSTRTPLRRSPSS